MYVEAEFKIEGMQLDSISVQCTSDQWLDLKTVIHNKINEIQNENYKKDNWQEEPTLKSVEQWGHYMVYNNWPRFGGVGLKGISDKKELTIKDVVKRIEKETGKYWYTSETK